MLIVPTTEDRCFGSVLESGQIKFTAGHRPPVKSTLCVLCMNSHKAMKPVTRVCIISHIISTVLHTQRNIFSNQEKNISIMVQNSICIISAFIHS